MSTQNEFLKNSSANSHLSMFPVCLGGQRRGRHRWSHRCKGIYIFAAFYLSWSTLPMWSHGFIIMVYMWYFSALIVSNSIQLFQPVANKSRERRHEGWVEADVWLWSSLRGTAGMKTRISTGSTEHLQTFCPQVCPLLRVEYSAATRVCVCVSHV